MRKICQCYHNWGVESPFCEIQFKTKHPNEQYCDSCKHIARRARVARNVARFRQRQKQAAYDLDVTMPDWIACWIDRVCTCCGIRGVPTFNRFLCMLCWETYADADYALHVSMEGEISWTQHDESPSKVTHYNDWNYTQVKLWALVAECRTGWKWSVPLSGRLKRLLSSMGLAEGNCSAY